MTFFNKLGWKKSIILGVIVVFILSLAGFWLWMSSSLNMKSTNQSAQFVEVLEGDTLNKICQRLQQQTIFEGCFALKLKAKISTELASIQKGTYQLEPNTTLIAFVNDLNSGKQVHFSFTIVEGDNIFQLVDRVQQKPYLVDDVSDLSSEQLAKELDLPYQSAEGWLFPDTYHYTAKSSALDLFKRAVVKQQQTLEEELEKIQHASELTPYQILTLASIVEKESSVSAERPLIASVFYNRLDKKMRLQTDPTVIYGVWSEYQGDITREHLKQYTPYNTYRINGLPPTPIANPSLASIRAVLSPARSDYYYFVAAGDGSHTFSKTLEEHNRAVRNYLRKQRIKQLKG